MRLVLLCLVFIAGVPGADWIRVKSPHFELYTTAGEKRGRETVEYFEQVRELFVRIWPNMMRDQVPVRIIGFSSEKEYRPYRMNEFAAAYYLPDFHRDYIVMSALSAEHYPIVVHEYTHLMMKHSGIHLPIWLNEGFADVNSTIQLNGDKLTLGEAYLGRMDELRRTKWLPIQTLTEVDYKSPEYNEKRRAGIFYAQSWLLSHMVYLSDAYRPKFNELIARLGTGTKADEAFSSIYGKTLVDVEADLKKYLGDNRINVVSMTARLEKPSERPQVEPAPEVELQTSLAILLSRTGKPAEGAEILAKLQKKYPERWEVEEALAQESLKKGDVAIAREHFRNAVKLGADNPDLLFTYGKLLQGDASKDDELIAVLKKAVAGRQEFTDAEILLGLTLYNTQNYKEAIAHLTGLKRVSPEQASAIFLALGYSYHRLGLTAPANEALRGARQYARSDFERQASQQLEDEIKRPAGAPAPSLSETYERPQSAMPGAAPESLLTATGVLERFECIGDSAKLYVRIAPVSGNF